MRRQAKPLKSMEFIEPADVPPPRPRPRPRPPPRRPVPGNELADSGVCESKITTFTRDLPIASEGTVTLIGSNTSESVWCCGNPHTGSLLLNDLNVWSVTVPWPPWAYSSQSRGAAAARNSAHTAKTMKPRIVITRLILWSNPATNFRLFMALVRISNVITVEFFVKSLQETWVWSPVNNCCSSAKRWTCIMFTQCNVRNLKLCSSTRRLESLGVSDA